jgi:predicted metal-dependent phosphoesterase TrpH
MLRYQRNKLISVMKASPNDIFVHGVLDDDIYSVELDVQFAREDLEVKSIDGKWNRYTTPECPRALDFLQPAVGMRLEYGFRGQVQKIIGRGSCRHFANLLMEMAHSARQAKMVLGYEEAKAGNPDLSWADYLAGQTDSPPSVETKQNAAKMEVREPAPTALRPHVKQDRKPGSGILIDIHTHTSPASPCSGISVDDLIDEAKGIGLDGIVLTDHNFVWNTSEIEALRQRHGFLVLGGSEITTDQGDVLVYGFPDHIDGIIRLEDLRPRVSAVGGYMSMAHPFRGFLVFGAHQVGLTEENAAKREMFRHVDAIEVLNGKVTADENSFAAQVAGILQMPGTAGSDAHEAGSVGQYATEFSGRIENEKDLVEALHSGAFKAVVFRGNE